MGYLVNNDVNNPEAITTVTDFITPDYVYGIVKSETGDSFYGINAKFFDDIECTIPTDVTEYPFSLEYTELEGDPTTINSWYLFPNDGIISSSFMIRCGIPHNAIDEDASFRNVYVKIKGWRVPNVSGLASIESYVKIIGKITLNPSSAVRKITITWL